MQIDPRHTEKIKELAENLKEDAITTAIHLAKSGAVSLEDYDPEAYVLAKVLLSAAIAQRAGDFLPLHDKKLMKTVKNLQKF